MGARNAGIGVVVCSVALSGCYSTGDGTHPPSNGLYFPVGLAVSSDAEWLYIANSDFDLQFNGGNVQVVKLKTLHNMIPSPEKPGDLCAGPGENHSPTLYPGPCAAIDL